MSGSQVVGGLLLLVLLLPWGCGGRTTADFLDATTGGAAVNGGAGNAVDECAGGAPDGGCGGEAGEHPLQDYARLRTACGRNLLVNRRGAAVSTCFHIR